MIRTLAMLAVAAASLTGWTLLRARRRQRLAGRPRAKPEGLQTWEGESGALPDGGPGRTVAGAPGEDGGGAGAASRRASRRARRS